MEQDLEQGYHKRNALDHLAGIVTNLSAGQRQLTQTALDYQCLALAKKRQIKEQIEMADEVGDILKVLIHLLKEATDEIADCRPELDD